MQKKKKFINIAYLLVAVAIVLPLWLGACEAAFPTRTEGGGLVKYPVPISTIFNVGSRAYANFTGAAGWLVEDTDNPGSYKLAPSGQHNDWNNDGEREFPGVRMFNIDRDLNLKNRLDISDYDGISFKYRTNATNTESRMLDCMFWWAYTNEYEFNTWNYRGGYDDPLWIRNPANVGEDPNAGPNAEIYKEVVIPFYRMWKWGTPQADDRPCYDTTRFNPNHFRNFRFDGRTIGSSGGGTLWIEIVDFAFFKYE